MYDTLWITQSPFTETAIPPPIAPKHGYIPGTCYYLIVYTRYYSNPAAVLCTGNITLLAHKEHIHGFPDFPVQQYSYFLFSTRCFFFSRGCQALRITYMHTRYTSTWYIHTAVYVVPWYHTTYIWYLILRSTSYLLVGKMPEIGIPPSDRATRRYTKVHLDFCIRFSTLIGQIGRVPLFGAGHRR